VSERTIDTEPVLSARRLVAGYRRGRRPLPIVTADRLEAHAGDLVAVIGPNGAGKSTLLRTFVGAQRSLGGEVLVGGERLATLDRRELARRVAVVLTDRVDAGWLSVGEVVLLGRHPHTGWTGRVDDTGAAVARAAADDLGLGEVWDARFAELSDGQRQRALIARALAQEPSVLVLDEPTAFLDVAGRVELTATLAGLAHRRRLGVLVSTHDLDLALAHADRVWLVHRGLVADDVPEALAADGRLAAAFDTDVVGFDAASMSFRGRAGAGIAVPVVVDDPVAAAMVLRLGGLPVRSVPGDAGPGTERRVLAGGGSWTYSDPAGSTTVGSLGELADVLRNRIGAPEPADTV